jgi:hypothetical protein
VVAAAGAATSGNGIQIFSSLKKAPGGGFKSTTGHFFA